MRFIRILTGVPCPHAHSWRSPCGPSPPRAQVREVVVGVTPTCPYGLMACWAGAYEALVRIDGVESVEKTPNAYNCTASVRLKGNGLPDPDKWASQFKAMVDQAYGFRGVEVTVSGQLEGRRRPRPPVPGVEQPIAVGHSVTSFSGTPRRGPASNPSPTSAMLISNSRPS